MNALIKENESSKEKLNFSLKQLDSLQIVKHELEAKIVFLNTELNKTRDMSSKFLNFEKEKRQLMEENSSIYFQKCLFLFFINSERFKII